MNDLVSVSYLSDHLNDYNLILIDSSIPRHMDNDAKVNYKLTIPNARKFHLKEHFADEASTYPNTLLSPERFQEECRKLGIDKDSMIIVFDDSGIYTSPRVWWMFRAMGHDNIAVLNGGLPQWIKKGFDTGNFIDPEDYKRGNFISNFREDFVVTFDEVSNNLKNENFVLVDARASGRFKGIDPEPRQNIKSGHIPYSINIPYKSLFTGFKFKKIKELKMILDEKIPNNSKVVFSCGSGITACIVMLAYQIAGREGKYLFDGSWAEWAIRNGITKD